MGNVTSSTTHSSKQGDKQSTAFIRKKKKPSKRGRGLPGGSNKKASTLNKAKDAFKRKPKNSKSTKRLLTKSPGQNSGKRRPSAFQVVRARVIPVKHQQQGDGKRRRSSFGSSLKGFGSRGSKQKKKTTTDGAKKNSVFSFPVEARSKKQRSSKKKRRSLI